MKEVIKRVLYVSFINIILACFAIMAFFATGSPLTALAEDASDNAQMDRTALTQKSERIVTATKEEYSDLVEYPYDDKIQAEMEKTGMTVGESLVDQLCNYQQLLLTATDEQEIENITALIEGTKNILDDYQETATDAQANTVSSRRARGVVIDNAVVAAAISWFNAANYLLAAELLTHAYTTTSTTVYNPVYGNRVVGSQITYDFLKGDLTNESVQYDLYKPDLFNATTCYEEDLGFALHKAKINRSDADSTVLLITDRYDFEREQAQNGILDDLVNLIVNAQENEVIVNYDIDIIVDMSDPLYLQLEGQENNTHSISVHNFSDQDIQVAYNTKMCSPDDAQAFSNLSHIDFLNIPAKGSKTVTIGTNGTASHITFCYVKNNYKIITYADELYMDRSILNLTFEKTRSNASDISLITKTGSNWLFYVTNTYGATMQVDYNSKMCNEEDAETWTNLKDVVSFDLSPNASKFIYISENGFATHIAVRFIGETYEYYIYANQLNTIGTMNISRRTARIYSYLQISNQGKSSGKWNIKITNPLSQSIVVCYNKKMCNLNDAKNWTGLSDIAFFILSPHGDETVAISENWFATSIAISYVYDDERLITYADGLSKNGSMNVYNSIA